MQSCGCPRQRPCTTLRRRRGTCSGSTGTHRLCSPPRALALHSAATQAPPPVRMQSMLIMIVAKPDMHEHVLTRNDSPSRGT